VRNARDRTLQRDRRWMREYRERNYLNPNSSKHEVVNVTAPEDVERRDAHEPCFKCGVRADVPCKHRPWMLRA
jgi:hypothetical protein